jgi:hypothetical protein
MVGVKWAMQILSVRTSPLPAGFVATAPIKQQYSTHNHRPSSLGMTILFLTSYAELLLRRDVSELLELLTCPRDHI